MFSFIAIRPPFLLRPDPVPSLVFRCLSDWRFRPYLSVLAVLVWLVALLLVIAARIFHQVGTRSLIAVRKILA